MNGLSALSEWVRAHDMTEQEAYSRSGLSYQTWRYVWAGYPTIPCLALTCGKNLGMTPEEVKPLGKKLDAANFDESDLLTVYPECFVEDWQNLVTTYNPPQPEDEEGRPLVLPTEKRRFYCVNCGNISGLDRKQKYCNACLSRLTTDEYGRNEALYGFANYCMCCGRPIAGRNKTKFCSKECSRIAVKHGPQSAPTNKLKCKYCGTLFMPRKEGQVYCTKSCEMDERRGIQRDRQTEFKCAWCGATFHDSTKRVHIYCSDNCRSKARAQRLREKRQQEEKENATEE